jgi:tetratricopeptide (TPR) repeat protein
MLGEFDDSRAVLVDLLRELEDRGAAVPLALSLAMGASSIELFAGDPAASIEYGLEGCRRLEEIGDKSWLSSAAGILAQAYYALGQFDEADSWATRAAELGASDDALTQMLWRQVKAKVLARRDEHAEAERLAREAVAIGDQTEIIDSRADASADLAEVLELAGNREEAAVELERALEFYRRKGNVVSAGRVEERVRELNV